tara:strand:- start:119 stop:499 length:381 start_codon:yes stop_codon:yes gene_type:complete
MSKYIYKVIIDWRGTAVEDLKDGIDTRFFGDKQQAEAFMLGFEAGNGFISIPDIGIEPVEDKLHWENHFGFFKNEDGSREATEELKTAISKFQIEYEKIKEKYKGIGMGDTDSDESIASYIYDKIH